MSVPSTVARRTPRHARPRAVRPWRSPRTLLAIAGVLVALAVAGAVVPGWVRDDDRPVDPTTPAAQRAAAVALEVVPGRVLGVARDVDNGKWEVTISQDGWEYEVELAPGDLRLLRLDYD